MEEVMQADLRKKIYNPETSPETVEPLIKMLIIGINAVISEIQGMMMNARIDDHAVRTLAAGLPAISFGAIYHAQQLDATLMALTVRYEGAVHVARTRVLSAEGKTPTAAVVEKIAESDPVAQAWDRIITELKVCRNVMHAAPNDLTLLCRSAVAMINNPMTFENASGMDASGDIGSDADVNGEGVAANLDESK